MIAKTREALKKLEFGILELLIGALMVIGLIGYFSGVPADLDWIDHTVSFIIFSYLFYKLNVTSILFGKTSRFANLIIIISYFSLFFKDIISYTSLDAFNFKVLKFVDNIYIFFSNNLFITNIVTFYIGSIGILIISIYLAKKIEVSHPSFLYAVYPKQIKNKFIKFLSIFILLLGFYYFVYNIILEWLEFTIGDPVIATGIVFFVYGIAKQHKKFHAGNFIFKIGDFSSKWYGRVVSLFHYKKTLPLAISGLFIMHAPFLKLFFGDAQGLPILSTISLLVAYLLNALSLVIFLIIPVIVWAKMFSQKEFHFSRVYLFFIYSSIIAYLLLPGYIIKPLSEPSIVGADIVTISLLETSSILDRFLANRLVIPVAVSLISVISGFVIYILSSNSKAKRELYAISIISGLVFYTIYLYYFFSSLLTYLCVNIMASMQAAHFLIGIVLGILLILSAMFYVGGYFMFLYEIVMEYHRRKWSDPIDEELVVAIKKIRSVKKRMLKAKKQVKAGQDKL